MMIRKLSLTVSILLGIIFNGLCQQTINFSSKDGLTITADLYFVNTQKPYILLLHQAGYSRGEYREIAPRLTRLGYNCLAIDQRAGYEAAFVKNETAMLAKKKGISAEYIDALQDIEAAIEYVKSKTDLPIVIWGSSYSASLALIYATKDLRVNAVVAFSPGEYFGQGDFVKSRIAKLSVPTLILSSKDECNMAREVVSTVKPSLITYHCPLDAGMHGAKALWKANPSHKDYWMSISMFFSKLN